MTVDGVLFHGARVQVLQETDRGGVLSMVICEGKNRQIRRMCAYADLTVLRLKRVREGAVRLGKLPVGQWRYLTLCAAGKVACKILQGFPAKLHFCLAFALF